jgi:hypothetical protein
MCRDPGQDGRLTGLYIPVSFVILRRAVLRVALAGTPSAQSWRANSSGGRPTQFDTGYSLAVRSLSGSVQPAACASPQEVR